MIPNFDHSYPPEPGYGYVAASRFKTKSGVHLYGKGRRTDFIPVHTKRDRYNYQHGRSDESDSDYASDGEEHEALAYQDHVAEKVSPSTEGH